MGLRGIAVIAATWLATAIPARAQYHLDDSLRGGTTGNAEGGSFGPDGWTVTTPTDRIWFAIPTTPQSGSIEFSVSGITHANLFPGDNDVFTMYDARDVAEPIRYLPEFGRNNYKIWLRLRTETDFVGMQKLVVAMCPDAETSWAEACACGEGFVEEVTGGDPAWDGSSQRLRFEFGGGHVRFFRNGVLVNDVDYAGSTGFGFGPREMHFSIGSTRSRAVSYSGMPVGAVFSDLVVDTVDGPVASCPGSGPIDAGPPSDGGLCDGAGIPIADVTAASWESGVFPNESDLIVEADGAGMPAAVTYLRFAAITGPVTRATLSMRTAPVSEAMGGSGRPCRVDGAWDETSTTWSTRPAITATCAGDARTVTASSIVEWDVTSLVAEGIEPSFAIVSSDADGTQYVSSEGGGCEEAPRLTVEHAPGSDGGPGADGDASSDIDATAGGGDGGPRGSRPSAGGCGCRAWGGASTGAPALLALVALVIARRRR